ncbi:MAG: hypothetical protein GWO20_03905 [Candidatus Korarchaeota archaeon]|nr:hypothetical protein [Candidatus Korarchaeota archaeon]NIU82557.1 hypothetical protein [Candidatus Thorarchaeota archaeon]NIW13045.1 hypothetical protein [Candidatus Thorarchaeota archaeon]NIW51220.1 hypothetical protein [Candidatus Korarchaeota archaeon]
MCKLNEEIRKKLSKIANARGKDFNDILKDYKENYTFVKKHYNVAEENVSQATIRRLLGKMIMSELTEVLIPYPVGVRR